MRPGGTETQYPVGTERGGKSMKQLRIGVIGTGHMGGSHVRVLSQESRFDLRGVYDNDPVQAERIGKQYDTKVFGSMEELLSEVEAVTIAVPSSLHREVGYLAAEHGVHAMIEKPLATDSRDAEELVRVFQEKGLKLQVGHIERFNPAVIELRKLIQTDQVIFIQANRYSPFSGSGRITDVSVIEDLMIHDIDLITSLMEPCEVRDIYGRGEMVRSSSCDFATCVLGFHQSTHAVINASRVSQNKVRTLNIYSEGNSIWVDLINRSVTVYKNTDVEALGQHEEYYRQEGITAKIYVPMEEPLRAELRSFYNAVALDRPVEVTGESGLRAVRICQEVARQVRQQNEERIRKEGFFA